MTDRFEALIDAQDVERVSSKSVHTAAEAAGVAAAVDNHASLGMTTILADATPGAGRFDAVAIHESENGWTLVIDEAKGRKGSVSLGTLETRRGLVVEQGTPEYLTEIFDRDPYIGPALADYAAEHPGFAEAWAAGEVDIRSRLVVARPNGQVGIADFILDESKIRLPAIPK